MAATMNCGKPALARCATERSVSALEGGGERSGAESNCNWLLAGR